jgi:anti-sigma factor RsiW
VRKDNAHSGETAFRYAFEDGVGVFYWIDDACGYAISGRIDRGQLLAIARVVYGQLAASEAAK